MNIQYITYSILHSILHSMFSLSSSHHLQLIQLIEDTTELIHFIKTLFFLKNLLILLLDHT